MSKAWQLQEAKAKLSQLIDNANKIGPQAITCRGQLCAVVMSNDDYNKLKGCKPNLVDFLRHSPLMGCELTITRDKSTLRKVSL